MKVCDCNSNITLVTDHAERTAELSELYESGIKVIEV